MYPIRQILGTNLNQYPLVFLEYGVELGMFVIFFLSFLILSFLFPIIKHLQYPIESITFFFLLQTHLRRRSISKSAELIMLTRYNSAQMLLSNSQNTGKLEHYPPIRLEFVLSTSVISSK